MPRAILARATAATLAAIAFASVLGQWALNTLQPDGSGWGAELWAMLRYFTILTNILTGVVLTRVALGRPPTAGVLAGTLLSIVMVGAVYHALLAPETPLDGLRWWTDFGFHTVVPVGTALWWLTFAPKALRIVQLPYWLLWPLGYCVYALARGALDGRYPYFFLDLDRFGTAYVAGYIAGLVAAFALVGLILWLIARLLSGTRGPARI
ncbi:MAG: hypothetical protein Kow0013_27430 [Pararhodobacter sp.]